MFNELKGKFITKIEGLEKNSEKVTFYTDDGDIYDMFHYQDCCEYVRLVDFNGFPEDIIGQEVLMAEESSSSSPTADYDYTDSSNTWTFYRLATIRGWLVLRWLGESNGWYSEAVDFVKRGNKNE